MNTNTYINLNKHKFEFELQGHSFEPIFPSKIEVKLIESYYS